MQKGKVLYKENAIELNGKPTFILSGETHYFRIKQSDWRDRIKKAKHANLNTVASYIPWRWHGLSDKKYDFTGKTNPSRNLIDFLDTIKKAGLYFIARIGPVCHGEMTNDGLPSWLFEKYPDIRLKDYAGHTNPYSNLIDYHNPTLHRYIKQWYKKLIPILKPYFYTNGGPIIMLQLDNEISMLNWLSKAPNYSKYATELFQKFMRKKYKTIKTLNKMLGTRYSSFKQVKQTDGNFNTKKGRLYFDWSDFYREYYALYYKKLYSYIKKDKGSIPVTANIPQIYDYDVKGRGNMGIMTTSMFKYFSKYVDDIAFGGAYQYRRVDYENFTDISAMTEVVRMITPPDNPIICAEMQTGIMFDRPVLYPSDVELNIKTSTATGLNGINCYMFCGGENVENMGGFGNHHDWQSAVGADGKPKPHYYALQDTGQMLKNYKNKIAKSKIKHDINIGLYLPYYQTEYLKGSFIDDLMRQRDTQLFDGLLRLILLSGYNYRFIDLEKTSISELKKLQNLWVFSLDFMDGNTQEKIVKYSESGNKNLFIYPLLPSKDLNFKSCNILKSYLDVDKVEGIVGSNKIKRTGSDYLYFGGGQVNKFMLKKSSESKPLFYTENNNITSFFLQKDKSNIIVNGFDLMHKFDFQLDFLKDFANRLNVKKQIKNENQRLNILRRYTQNTDILFAANYTEMEQQSKVNLYENCYPVDMNLTVPGRKSLILFTNYKINKDIVLYYITTEIKKVKKKNNKIVLTLNNLGKNINICYLGDYSLSSDSKVKKIKDTKEYKLYKIICSDKNDIEIVLSK